MKGATGQIDAVSIQQMRVRDVEGATKGEIWFKSDPTINEEILLIRMKRAKPGDVMLVFRADIEALEGKRLSADQKATPINGPCYDELSGILNGLDMLRESIMHAMDDKITRTESTETPSDESIGAKEPLFGIETEGLPRDINRIINDNFVSLVSDADTSRYAPEALPKFIVDAMVMSVVEPEQGGEVTQTCGKCMAYKTIGGNISYACDEPRSRLYLVQITPECKGCEYFIAKEPSDG